MAAVLTGRLGDGAPVAGRQVMSPHHLVFGFEASAVKPRLTRSASSRRSPLVSTF
jgi:hypothetical protein